MISLFGWLDGCIALGNVADDPVAIRSGKIEVALRSNFHPEDGLDIHSDEYIKLRIARRARTY